jgi:hypothetical protein
MLEFYDDDDAATNWIERRWFAAAAAVEAMEGECDLLREVMLLAEDAYRRARVDLAELTVLRDSLGERLANPEALQERAPPAARIRLSLSAA